MYLNYNSYTLHSSWGLPCKDKGACHNFLEETLKGTFQVPVFLGVTLYEVLIPKHLPPVKFFGSIPYREPQMLLPWTF